MCTPTLYEIYSRLTDKVRQSINFKILARVELETLVLTNDVRLNMGLVLNIFEYQF